MFHGNYGRIAVPRALLVMMVSIGVLILSPLASLAGPATPVAYNSVIDPGNFVARIDDPYMPLVPGTIFRYEGVKEGQPQTNDVTVTADIRMILGVPCVVVHDQVKADGHLIEETYDWYTQDRAGNVWYFGEASTSYEQGKAVSTKGSWEAGVDGAKPGIVMRVQPILGETYRQEYLKGEAEDMAKVLRTGSSVKVAYGSFDHVMVTEEWTPLEPAIAEEKSYAPGVGFVLAVSVKGENERLELVEVVTPGDATPAATPAR